MVFSLLGMENTPISFSKDALQSLPRGGEVGGEELNLNPSCWPSFKMLKSEKTYCA